MKTIGRYEIQKEAGRGGMSNVYEAFDPRFQRTVAVKVMTAELLDNPTLIARFEREARTIASLEHPSIVPVYDFGDDDKRPFLVMRYMSGGTLADRLQQGPLSVAETAKILQRIGSALDRAHDQGVIHRDLKPSNIMFDQYGDAFLADFGIARLTEEAVTLTGQNVIGTPAYMSPEQIHGDRPVDGRSDIYALGVICFEMLTGRRPFEEKAPARLMMQHLIDPVPNIRELRPDLPPGVEEVILRSMAKSPDERYMDAAELCDTLDSLATIDPAAATAAKAASAELQAAGGASGSGEMELTVPDSAEMRAPQAAEPLAEAADQEQAPVLGAAAPAEAALEPDHEQQPEPSSVDLAEAVPDPDHEQQPELSSAAVAAGDSGGGRSRWLLIAGLAAALLIIAAVAYAIFGAGFSSNGGPSPAAVGDEEPQSGADAGQSGAAGQVGEAQGLAEEDAQATADASMERFYQAMDEEDFDTAAAALAQAIALFPDEAWLYSEKAWLAGSTGDLDGALEAMTQAIERAPEEGDYYTARGNIWREMGDMESALEDHKRAVELAPNVMEAHIELSQTYADLGQLDPALAQANEALDLKDDEAWPYDTRAGIYIMMGDYERALADLERGAELDPENRSYFTHAGDVFLYDLEDPEQALEMYTRAVERSPDDPWVYVDRANAYSAMGAVDEALADINRGIEMDPENAHFYISRSQLYQNELGDFDAALDDLNMAAEVDPENADVFGERASFFQYHRDDLQAALEDRSRAVELDPQGPWRYNDRATVLRQLGREDEALDDLNTCLDLDPDYYWCLWERAWILDTFERVPQAVEDLRRFLDLAPEDECPECSAEARAYIADNE